MKLILSHRGRETAHKSGKSGVHAMLTTITIGCVVVIVLLSAVGGEAGNGEAETQVNEVWAREQVRDDMEA